MSELGNVSEWKPPQDLKLFAATRAELIDSRTGDAYPVVSFSVGHCFESV
jgi:hypothetical protein